jgi:hypothetical protein
MEIPPPCCSHRNIDDFEMLAAGAREAVNIRGLNDNHATGGEVRFSTIEMMDSAPRGYEEDLEEVVGVANGGLMTTEVCHGHVRAMRGNSEGLEEDFLHQ